MRIHEIITALEQWAPPGLAYTWDKPGLSLGHPDADADAVLVALTVTEQARRRAAAAKAQVIVSHHPLIWEPLTALRTDDPQVQLCLKLARDGIACYAAHTNLDVVPRGVSWLLAQQLGLEQPKPLFPGDQGDQVKLITFVPEAHLDEVRAAICQAGAGIIGDYTYCTYSSAGQGTFMPGNAANPFSGARGRLNVEDERRIECVVMQARLEPVLAALRAAHPYEEPAVDVVPLLNKDQTVGLGVRGALAKPLTLDAFAAQVAERLNLSHLRVVGAAQRLVQDVAVLGGAGGSSIARVPKGVDVFVTGDVGYHDAVAAELRGLAVIDAGHSGTEKVIVPAVAAYLKRHCPQLRVKTYVEADVFRVVTGE